MVRRHKQGILRIKTDICRSCTPEEAFAVIFTILLPDQDTNIAPQFANLSMTINL